jgi:hypothetical protein
MLKFRVLAGGLACAALIFAAGCAAPPKTDYSAYRAHLPKSILVLPPLNETVEVNASYSYLSTITRPLAEAGYYVFPVAVVDAFMKENGLPTPAEMQAVSLDKIRQIFGADAVLYVTIQDYGQKYQILSSNTVFKAHATLVDVNSGTRLWEGTAYGFQGSGDSGAGPIGMLVTAVVTQVLASTSDDAHDLAATANAQMISNPSNGLLLGPYNPGYEADVRGRETVAPAETASPAPASGAGPQ